MATIDPAASRCLSVEDVLDRTGLSRCFLYEALDPAKAASKGIPPLPSIERAGAARSGRGAMRPAPRVGDRKRTEGAMMVTNATPPSPAAAALAYGTAGWPVFPIKARGKEPLLKWKEAATSEPNIIGQWWQDWPDANIGLLVPEGFFVLDIDGEEGEASLRRLQEEHGNAPLPACPVARTGKGRHLWFRSPAGYELENGVKRLPEIDVRTVGGYVVVPPSVHPSGAVYTWEEAPAFARDAIPEAPARLLEALAAERERGPVIDLSDVEPQRPPEAHRLEALLGEMRKARQGERNSKLHRVARRLVEMEQEGRLPSDAWARLREAARSTGLGEPEIDKTIASARRRGAAQASPAPGRSGAAPIAPPLPAPPAMPACGWPDPEPLRPPGSTPRPYPIAVLPEPIREAVIAYQRFGKQPVALVAMSALAAASLACQVHVDVERLPGLSGPISLDLLTIAQSDELETSATGTSSGHSTSGSRNARQTWLDAVSSASPRGCRRTPPRFV